MAHDDDDKLLGSLHAANHLPADLMLVKMEGEHIMTMAAARKVHLPTVIKEAEELLEANPIAAQAAVYSKPVGMKPDVCRKCGHKVNRKAWQKADPHCPKCGGKAPNNLMVAGKQTYARGLSIKAATSLANLVGYNRVASSFAPVADGIYRVTSIFTDYSRGIIRSKERLVSQWRRAWGTNKLEKQDDERFLEMTLLGAQSKNERNAIIAGLPYELAQAYEQKALEVAPRFLNAEKMGEIVEAFAGLGFNLADLQILVGRSKTDGWRKEEHELLRGTWVALENGEMTVEELMKELRPGPNDDPANDNGTPEPEAAGGDPEPTKAPAKPRRAPAAANQAQNVASELTGAPADKAPPAQTTRAPATPAAPSRSERPAWMGLADEAGTAYQTGRFAYAARKYNEAAGLHPSNSPDDPKVRSLLNAAKTCQSKADAEEAATMAAAGSEGEPEPEVVPAPQETPTKPARAPATPAKPAAPAGAPRAAPAPPGAPVAPTGDRATVGGAKRSWTPTTCREYLSHKWGEEMGNYDVDRLCDVAANQGAPQIFLDNLMSRANPAWSNFVVKPTEPEGGDQDPEPPFDTGEVGPVGELTEDQLAELDRKDPITRPVMPSSECSGYEKTIRAYNQLKRIDTLIADKVEPSAELTNDEVSWLKFVARARKREIAAGTSGTLPGME